MKIFNKDYPPGIYKIESSINIEDLFHFTKQQDFELIRINGKEILNKKMFLQKFAESASFPEYFGQNWDAFWECIVDLEWLPAKGYVIYYENPDFFISNAPSEWEIALDILVKAVDFWKNIEIPLYVLLKGTNLKLDEVKTIIV